MTRFIGASGALMELSRFNCIKILFSTYTAKYPEGMVFKTGIPIAHSIVFFNDEQERGGHTYHDNAHDAMNTRILIYKINERKCFKSQTEKLFHFKVKLIKVRF